MKIRLYSAGAFVGEYCIDDYEVSGAHKTVSFWLGAEFYVWHGDFLVSGGHKR